MSAHHREWQHTGKKHGIIRRDALGLYPSKMNYQDGVRVFATGIEDARHEQQTRGPDVRPVVDFKLTVDLSKRSLHEIPDEVVDLLKVEVERWVIPLSNRKASRTLWLTARRQSSTRAQSHTLHSRFVLAMSPPEVPEFTGQHVPGVPTTREQTLL